MTRGHSASVRNFQVENDGGEETSGRMEQSELHEHCPGGVVHPMRGRQSLNLKHGLIPTNAETKKKLIHDDSLSFIVVYFAINTIYNIAFLIFMYFSAFLIGKFKFQFKMYNRKLGEVHS